MFIVVIPQSSSRTTLSFVAIFAKTNRLLIHVSQRFLQGLSGWGEDEAGVLFSGSQSIDACPFVRIPYAAILA
jgi:hypothetical protein